MRILYIDIDSLRPDHLSCYGYPRLTSPNIDAVAAQGIRFDEFYATDTPCLPSRTAFFTGQFGVNSGVVNHGGVRADVRVQEPYRGFRSQLAENALAARLSYLGLHTCSISPFPRRHSAYQVTYGFRETHDTGRGGMDDAHEIWAKLEPWLRSNATRDGWFLHVNFWDPHTPYDSPESFGNPFEVEPLEGWLTQEILDQQNQSYGPHSAREVPGFTDELSPGWRMGVGAVRNLADAKRHVDGYDTGIRYADLYLGKVFDLLRDLGVYDETAVIISADHGENQGELNVWGDHQTADRCTNRLPLILRWPGKTDVNAGSVKRGLYYHVDLSATILDWAGGVRPETWDGRSFDELGAGRDQLVLSQGAWSCQRSVRWDRWLLIRTYHTGLKQFPAWMLFDLSTDPHETTDLAPSRPDIVGEGAKRLDAWLGEQMHSGRCHGDPFWEVIAEGGPLHANIGLSEWPAYLERLRQTGRADHADRLDKIGGRPVDA